MWFLGSNCQATNPETAATGYDSCPQIQDGSDGYEEIDTTECFNSGHWCQLALDQPNTYPTCQYPNDTNWHTYVFTWTADAISMSVDGQPTGCSFTKAEGYVIPNKPMFMIIQTQTGGVSGTPNNADLPTELQIADITVTQP